MPAAKNAADAAPAPADAPAPLSTVAAPNGLSRLLSRAADAAAYGGVSDKAPVLSALSARMDDMLVALPAALAVADGDLKDALTALSALLN